MTMLITTLLFFVVATKIWNWSLLKTLIPVMTFVVVDVILLERSSS
jgi:K+ transporter